VEFMAATPNRYAVPLVSPSKTTEVAGAGTTTERTAVPLSNAVTT